VSCETAPRNAKCQHERERRLPRRITSAATVQIHHRADTFNVRCRPPFRKRRRLSRHQQPSTRCRRRRTALAREPAQVAGRASCQRGEFVVQTTHNVKDEAQPGGRRTIHAVTASRYARQMFEKNSNIIRPETVIPAPLRSDAR